MGNAVVVAVQGDVVGGLLEVVNGVAHGDGAACLTEHRQVVDLVADGDDFLRGDAVLAGDPVDAAPLVDAGGEDLQDMDGLFLAFILLLMESLLFIKLYTWSLFE